MVAEETKVQQPESICMDFSSSFKAKTRGKKSKKPTKIDDEKDALDDVNRDLEDDNLLQEDVVIEIARNLTITTKQMSERKVLD